MIKLTKRQEGFCQSYLLHGNAAQAYRENYNAEKMSNKTIWEAASRLLSNSKVAARLNELKEKAASRHEGIQDRIIDEYANIAFADPSALYNWNENGVTIKPSDELTKRQLATVSGASQTVTQFGGTIKITMHNKVSALDSLARVFGMNKDSLIINNDAELAQKARERLIAINGGKNTNKKD